MSNNVILCFHSWFVGLTDGEGYFLITKAKSNRSSSGFLYIPQFGIGLRKDDTKVLLLLKEKLGIGTFSIANRQKKDIHMPMCRFIVSGVNSCKKLIDIFDKFPLQTKKRRDYVVWRAFITYKLEYGNKMPMSMNEYFYHRIREVRKYNKVLADSYEIDLRSKSPILKGDKK